MLSTDTNTISITLPSPPLPQPASQRHPQINPCAEMNAEETIQSHDGPGQAVCWEEPFLLFQPQQHWLHWQLARSGEASTFFWGEHNASPDLLQVPSTCTAQGSARSTSCPSTIPSPGHSDFPPGELGQQPPALPLFRLLPWSHAGSLSCSAGHFCSLCIPILLVRSKNVRGCTHAFQLAKQQY